MRKSSARQKATKEAAGTWVERLRLIAKLRRYSRARQLVQIKRNRGKKWWFNGIVVGVGRDLILVHVFNDFWPDGYSIFRIEDIVEIRRSEHERVWERMLSAEGLLTGLSKVPAAELVSMARAVESVAGFYDPVIIQCEQVDSETMDFYVGTIRYVGDRMVEFHHFDANGRWDKARKWIKIDEITRLQIETPYGRMFKKYVGGPVCIPRRGKR